MLNVKKYGRRVGVAAILLFAAVGAVCLTNAGASSKEFDNTGAEETKAENNQKAAKNNLTMAQLTELCTADNWTKEIESKGLKLFTDYDNIQKDKENIEESLTGTCHIALDYNSRSYDLQIYYWLAEAVEEYGNKGEIDSVLIVDTETGDAQLLYSVDETYEVNVDLDSFLSKVYDIRRELSFTLPEGLKLGKYVAELTDTFSGHLFESNGKDDFSGDSVSVLKTESGGIGVNRYRNDIFEFKDGKVKTFNGIRQNHMGIILEGEWIENDDMTACLCEYEFELFTVPEQEEYEREHNVTLSRKESTSRYWYAFLGTEGEEETYVVYLNADLFSKKDMKDFVKTIHKNI